MKELPLQEFAQAVNYATGFTAQRDIVPALTYLYFTNKDIRAFSGRAGAVYRKPWDVGEGVVPAAPLAQLLNALVHRGHDTGEIKLTDFHCGVIAGKFRGQLPLLPSTVEAPREYILRPIPKPSVSLTPGFWEDLAKLEFAVAKDETKQALRGVYWARNGALLATDNNRMIMCFPDKDTTKPPQGLLLPDYFLQMLTTGRELFTGMTIEENTLWLHGATRCVYGQLLEGEFPATGAMGFLKATRTLAEGTGTWVTLPDVTDWGKVLAPMLDIFSRAPLFRLKVDVGKENVKFLVEEQDGDGYAAEETVPATKIEGPACEFFLNGKYFIDLLAVSSRFWYMPGKPLYCINHVKRLEHILAPLA